MLEFAYMQRALLAGALLSIAIPLIGVVMVNRKTAMIGDALSHTSLAGVGLGLILGMNPVGGAVLICIVSAFAIEFFRKRFPQYGDLATAVIMSSGLGIAAILSDLAPGGNSFEAYLFGSISSVSEKDLIFVGICFVLVIWASLHYYAALLDLAIDKNLARLAGVPVRYINAIFTCLTALTIGISIKIVGGLMVTSLMVLPVAAALMISRSYKTTVITSVCLGFVYMLVGLTSSYYMDVKPGGTIVMTSVIGLLITTVLSRVRKAPKETIAKTH